MKLRITKHIPLESASKTHAPNGEHADDSNPSEWAVAMAMANFEVDTDFEEEEFEKALHEAMVQQNLDAMVEEGLVEMLWDEEKQDFTYRIKE